ncbi:MAG: histidine kinase [Verrucomicrobia bacterium]|nr:histidine kinase [Verrucomicrobiota bacterium]
MSRVQKISLLTLLTGILPIAAVPPETDAMLKGLTLTGLEQHLAAIDSDLEQLANFSLRTGIGTVGWRSDPSDQGHHTEWIEIELGEKTPIDQIILVPTIWRDTKMGFRADGFPLEFRILTGSDQDRTGTAIASFGIQDKLLPRIAPLVVPCTGTTASWVRLETSALSPRAWDGKYILQMDEILVFSGQENIALQKPVRVSSNDSPEGRSRLKQNLVDGFVPYLMDASQGEQSIAFFSKGELSDRPTLMIDLGSVEPLNRINLHTIELSDTVPQTSPLGLGLPRHLIVEGAKQPDFSDAVRLIEYIEKSIYDAGPIIMRRFPETACRYVRLIAIDPYIYPEDDTKESAIGFAEIEIFSKGRNVAFGKPTTGNCKLTFPNRSYFALTDGRNLYGNILPIREWLNELARRHELETERPIVFAELNHHYARQKEYLSLLAWLAVVLAVGIVITILIDRILRLRQVARIRERLAADLHDELGADLHTIGLLSDLAEDAKEDTEELAMLHQRIRRVTEQSGAAVRHCTDMLEANGLNTNIKENILRASRRIMAKLENNISIEGEEYLNKLKPNTRFDLILFYNECLVNISRHSQASQFTTHLMADNKEILLSVSDNGRGISEFRVNGVPKSLKRRARLLGAKVSVDRPATGGTCINLKLRTRRWGRHR